MQYIEEFNFEKVRRGRLYVMDSNIDPKFTESASYQIPFERNDKYIQIANSNGRHHDSGAIGRTEPMKSMISLEDYDPHSRSSQGIKQNASSTAAMALNMLQLGEYETQNISLVNQVDVLRLSSDQKEQNIFPKPSIRTSLPCKKDKFAGVKLVQYNPAKKTKRLGRPRKHIINQLEPVEHLATQNYNASMLTKFRFDRLPVEGPGSRGGKCLRNTPKGRVTYKSLKNKKHSSSLQTEPDKSHLFPNDLRLISENVQFKPTDLISIDSVKEKMPLTEASEKGKNSGRFMPKDRLLDKMKTSPLKSRELIKKKDHNNGPLFGLDYNLYDKAILKQESNKDSSEEKLSLGYPVNSSPYAPDIIKIISFLIKFKDIVLLDRVGPQNIENGLSLPINKAQDRINDIDETYVSPEMDLLFKRLVALVLNVDVHSMRLSSAKSTLLDMSHVLGLPSEWRNNKKLPIDSPQFERLGLAGMVNPIDRLVMLRTLVIWSLSSSEKIRGQIDQFAYPSSLSSTSYAARFVIKGIKKAKNHSMSDVLKSPSTFDSKDMLSDPLKDTLSLRLEESLIGDCGLHVGRFYLARMADVSSGGLGSIADLKNAIESDRSTSVTSSSFKLYVQDVQSMLDNTLNYDMEFDADNEVDNETTFNNHWYEVAHDLDGLKSFVDYISGKLGRCFSENVSSYINKSSILYRPVFQMYRYLSLIVGILSQDVDNNRELFHNLEVTSSDSELDYSSSENPQGYLEYNDSETDDDYEIDNEGLMNTISNNLIK